MGDTTCELSEEQIVAALAVEASESQRGKVEDAVAIKLRRRDDTLYRRALKRERKEAVCGRMPPQAGAGSHQVPQSWRPHIHGQAHPACAGESRIELSNSVWIHWKSHARAALWPAAGAHSRRPVVGARWALPSTRTEP
jgi:hypothetical protein